MIEFSKIKKITIKEGVVKKITNSSGIVLWSEPSIDTGSITVDLNNQWVESTKKLDGYLVFMSNSNKGVANGYASMKIKFKGKPDFKIWINSYADNANFTFDEDMTIAFNMDVDYPDRDPLRNLIGDRKLTTKGFQKKPTTIDNFKEVDYPNDGGEHFVVVTYAKDYSGNYNDDRGYVAIKVGKLLSTSWVVSSTEFIKENDKYYQKINEFETYDGGITAPTGSFKKGNELTPTYIQSSDANDYMLDGSTMYYKKYAWVTPVDTAINTGDYIQGDYIGEATPSMKVTYTDGTEKTFYNLASIETETIPNKANVKSVEIYDGVTSIGSSAIRNIKGITEITLPSSVTVLGWYSISDNPNLASVTIENQNNKLSYSSEPFFNISSAAKLYVPSNLLSDYQADEKWTKAFKGGIEAIGDTSSVTVDLNNQWVESTKKLVGYDVYMSNSNKGVDNGYASMKIKFKGKPDFKIWINSYAEEIYDYTIAFDMDVDYPTSNPSTSSTGVKLHTSGFQKDPTAIDNFKEVDYPNDGGEHFVVVTFRKDSSGDNSDDRGYVAIKLTPISTSWVLSSTEFIKDSDKYYQRINEIGTYEGGLTAATGNFKSGNELTPTYIQSSDANDYMLVGSGMYYKKYAWVTPVDTAVNTGDYIQGDYIGEATPSMKVTYTDNTEKEFYNLTSIEYDTDANKANAKSVEIYDSVTSIGLGAFGDCSGLTSVVIPDSTRSIDGYAFYGCKSLASVTIKNSTSKLTYNEYAFDGISSTAKLYVPSNLLSEYQADTNWTGAFPGGIYAIGS